ncbi:MAG: hypothetical protein F7B18_08810 [Desulfurococcales archaeon]|nr:hypothetical protein [Desulfurococcales archaeon]
MSFRISRIANVMDKCEELERKLGSLPAWRPKAKYMIAEAVASCIAKMLGDIVEEIHYIDLSGGETVTDFSGRDIDLVIKVKGEVRGLEGDLKAALEYAFNAALKQLVAQYIAETGKKELLEVHVISDYNMGYGRLIFSKYYPSIRLWPPKRDLLDLV